MSHIMNTYARFDVTFTRGEGATLYDDAGKAYIDFASGIGVNSVGYAHPEWVAAVSQQAATLAHVSNLYHTQPAAALADKLCALSGLDSVFFANSGAEANEGAIKLARKYARDKRGEGEYLIATLTNSFHGRTMATLSATGQDKFHQHFDPFLKGFIHIDAHDVTALNNLPDNVIAILAEPVQGEGGVLPLTPDYWQALRRWCSDHDALLLADEVQTGLGRTGGWFAYQALGATPDVVTFAKGVAGGLPLGGLIATKHCADTLTPGTHATTFGANPVCCAAALATLAILERELPRLPAKAQRLNEALTALNLGPVRGAGLMLGVQVGPQVRDVVQRLLHNGVVALTAGADVLRLLPPLTISDAELDKGITILNQTIKEALA